MFIEIASPTEIARSLWLTGPVPRLVETYNGPKGLCVDGPVSQIEDTIMDNKPLRYLTDLGWLVTSGCGHSGPINTGTVLQSIKEEPVYSIVGGFHLWRADQQTLDKTAS